MPFGEVTITLEDVAVQLGLRIKGKAITGGSIWNLERLYVLCDNLLGITPEGNPEEAFDRGSILFDWLQQNLLNLPAQASELEIIHLWTNVHSASYWKTRISW